MFFRDFLKGEFKKEGVDVGQLQTDEEANAGFMSILVTPDGERTVFCNRGANTCLDPEKIDQDYVKKADILHVSGYTFIQPPQRGAGRQIIGVAEEEGLQISLDLGLMSLKEVREEIESIMPSVDLLLLSEPELRILSNLEDRKEAGKQLLEKGPSVVVLKLGKKGCLTLTKEKESFAKGFSTNIVDMTGAGDAFNAAFIGGFERGWDLDRVTRFANTTGGISATNIGARSGLPEFGEVEKLLRRETSVENQGD